MEPRIPPAAQSARTLPDLFTRLSETERAILELKGRAEAVRDSDSVQSLGFSRRHLGALCDLLSEGGGALRRRILQLGFAPAAAPAATPEPPRRLLWDPAELIAPYRTCSRALCQAMKAAICESDSTTAAILKDLILRLEKQLWVIDEPAYTRGAEESRAVSLFLSC